MNPDDALNPQTQQSVVTAYNAEVTKLQGISTTAQGALWGLQKATEAASKTFASTAPSVAAAAAGFEKLQITAGKTGQILQKGFEIGQTLKVLEILKDGAMQVVAQFDRIPQALALMNASGVSTGVIDEFSQLGDALKLNSAAIDQFSLNAVARFNEFNAALTRVNTLFTKESGFNAEKYGADIQKLVNGPLKNAVSSTEALEGAYNAISAGFTKAADSQAVMTAGLKLAKAGSADSAAVLKLLGSTLNAYGKSASEAAKVGAQLNLIVQKGITTIPELANGFAETATTAKSAGISLEDLAASVAVLTTKGNSTPSALTGIESIARNIIAKTPEATKALEGLVDAAGKSVKFDITEIKTDGLAKSLQRLNQAVGGNVVKLKEIIPESRAYATALALMQNNSKDLTDISLQMGQVTAKALDQVFGTQLAQKSEKFVQIVNRFGEVMIRLGQSLTPAFESGIKVLDTVSDIIAKIPDGIKENIAQFLLAGIVFKQTTGALTTFAATLAKAFITFQGFRLVNMAFNGELFKQIEIIGKLSKANAGLIPIALQLFGVDQQRILAERDLLVGAEKDILMSRSRFAAAKELAVQKKDLAGAIKTLIGLDSEALTVSKRVAQSYDEQVAAIQPLLNANKAVKKSRDEANQANEAFTKAQEKLVSKQQQFAALEEKLAKQREAQKTAESTASKLLNKSDTAPEVRKQIVETVETTKKDVSKTETERIIRLKEIQRQEEAVTKARQKADELVSKEADTVARVTKSQLELVGARRKAIELQQAAKEAETLAEVANTEAKTANALANQAGFKDVALNTAAEEANTVAKTQNAIASKARTAATEADVAVRKLNTELLRNEALAENKLIETRLLGLKTTVGNNTITKIFTTNVSDAFKNVGKVIGDTLGFSKDRISDFFGFLVKRSSGGFFKGLKEDFVSNFKTIKDTIENPVDSFKKLKTGATDSFNAITNASKSLRKDNGGLFTGLISSASGFFDVLKNRSKDAGKALSSVATGLTSGVGTAINSLKGFQLSFAGLQAAITGGLSGIVGLLTTGLSGALAAAGTGFGLIATAASTAWTAITGPLAPIVLLIGAVTAGVALLYDKFFGLGKAADNLTKELGKIGTETKASLDDVDKTFKNTSDAIDQTIIASFKDLGQQAPKELLGVKEAIQPVTDTIEEQRTGFLGLWDAIRDGSGESAQSIKNFGNNFAGIKSAVVGTINTVTKFFADLYKTIKELPVVGNIIAWVEGVSNKVKEVVGSITGIFKGIGGAFKAISDNYKLDQVVKPVNELRKAGADLATDQLRASAAIGVYNKGLFQSAELNKLVLQSTKLTAEQQAIKTGLMDKEAAQMQRLVDRANAETEANNKRIEEAQKLADQYKKGNMIRDEATGQDKEDIKTADVRRQKLLEEIDAIEQKNEKLKRSVATAKEELDLVIKTQQERERLQERIRKNKGEDLDPTKGDVAGENEVKNALNRGLQASGEELDTYAKKVQAVLDGTGKYVSVTTDKTGKKVSNTVKLALTDMEGATDKLDEKVASAVGAVDALFEQGYIDSDKAAEQVTATLEKTVTGATGKVQKLKELLDPQTQIDLINKVLDYQQKASQNAIGLKTKEVERLRALDSARLVDSTTTAKKIREIEAEQLEVQRTSLEKQINALVSSRQASPQKLKELTADLEKLKVDQKAKDISNSVANANEQNNIVKEQLSKELDLQKTYQESKIGNVEAATKKIREIENKQLEIQRSSIQNEIKVLTEKGADPKRIAELQQEVEKLNVQQRAKRMNDRIEDANKEVEDRKEKLGQQLELEKIYQQARLKDNVETTKKIGELELQQLQQSKVALQGRLKILKESGADPEEIKKVENQITNIQVQESAKRITNIQAEMNARVTQLKQSTDKTLAVEELARLKGERSFKESTEKSYKLRQETNVKEQQLIVEQINRTKSAGGNTDELQKQLIDKQIDYQRLLTEKIQKEVERRKAILANSISDQVLQQTKLLDSLDAQQKSLESETKLQESRKSLLAAQNEYAVGMLQNQLKVTSDVEKRATIERQIAERNEKNLLQQQQGELDNLKVQEQQNKLAQEKETIQLRVSQLQNKLSQDQLKIDIESAKRTKSKSDEELASMQSQLNTLVEQGQVLSTQQQFIDKNAVAQQEITKNSRMQLEYKQRLSRENARIDVELAKNREVLAVYEKQAQAAKLRADISQTIGEVELKQQESIGKAYEARTKLLNQQKSIVDESLASAQSNYQIAADLTTDEKQKSQIQKEALIVRMTTLNQQQKIERELFEIQLKQNKLALERQKIEAQIAVIRKQAELQAAIADDKRVQADKTKTKEEKEASRATLEAKKVDVAAAQYQQDIVKQQEQLSEKDNQAERQKLLGKQRQDAFQMRVEYAKSTEDKTDDVAVRNEALSTARNTVNNIQPQSKALEGLNNNLPKFEDYIKRLNVSLPKLSDVTQEAVQSTVRQSKTINNSTTNTSENKREGDLKVDAPITVKIERDADKDLANEVGTEIYDNLYNVIHKVRQRT
jgi:hypothetical protein